ncbi:hypothetical protein DFH08DRAFT_1031642 [Mycena albidolilacea]|uniref:Uncharacterized protein n=1 Tax=Mycena albidolilacea TaxID=1033008 RepID=A0AAD7AJU3_9AGAR|nr:hypothetical protein DFH08DRAFT_1031642 [Mycena albidolilacea]
MVREPSCDCSLSEASRKGSAPRKKSGSSSSEHTNPTVRRSGNLGGDRNTSTGVQLKVGISIASFYADLSHGAFGIKCDQRNTHPVVSAMPTSAKTRERAILDAVKSTIAQPDFKVQLPWIPPATWNTMLSTNDKVREGYKCLGRAAFHLAFAVSFTDACGGLGVGCPVGMFGTLENCLLSEEVLFELMKKPCHRNTRLRVASKGVALVRDAVHIFLGGLWNSDTENLGQILPWVIVRLHPLPPLVPLLTLVSRLPKRARNPTNNQHPVELRGIQRIYVLQFAGRPLKISKAQEEQYLELIDSLLTTPPASPYPYLAGEDDELETDANADDWVNILQAPSTSSRIYRARIAREPLAVLAAVPPTVRKTSAVLQKPISLKRKNPPDVDDTQEPLAPVVAPPRKPLAPKRLQHGIWAPCRRTSY